MQVNNKRSSCRWNEKTAVKVYAAQMTKNKQRGLIHVKMLSVGIEINDYAIFYVINNAKNCKNIFNSNHIKIIKIYLHELQHLKNLQAAEFYNFNSSLCAQ